MIEEAADRHPEATAIRCGGESLSYEALVRKSHGLAHLLLETGLQRQDRVAVLLGKSLEVPVSFYSVMGAGGTLVPIDPRSPADRVAQILQATQATHLISEAEKSKVVQAAVEHCPDLRHLIGVELEAEVACRSHSWEVAAGLASDRGPEVRVTELDPSYILHTSGSTGMPKLILHTHRSATSFVEWAVGEYRLTAEDRLSNHSPHHTCFATFDYYAAAAVGAATVILTPSVLMMPASLATLIEDEQISVWYSVPAALIQLSLRGDLEARSLVSLRWILFAGEAFPEKHLRRLMQQIPSARFSHVYGSTEVNVCTYYHLPEDGDFVVPLPIGKACSNATVEVVDEDLRTLQPGEVGEFLVRGTTVMEGYWGDPARNRDVLVRRPAAGDIEQVFFRTGDRGRVLEDGNLTFVARADLQVKVRGYRVELGEVEDALLSLDSVEEAAAFTVPDGEGSSSLRAAVVPTEATASPGHKIQAELKSKLPTHAVPTTIVMLDSLPRTPTGKIDRLALQNLSQSEVSPSHE